MQTLTDSEVEVVAGGLVPLLVTLGFVWANADRLRDFANGFFDGLLD